VKNAAGEVAFNNFVFNGWAKYNNHKKDAQIVARANKSLKQTLFLPMHNGRRVVLEGGSIDVNGAERFLQPKNACKAIFRNAIPVFPSVITKKSSAINSAFPT